MEGAQKNGQPTHPLVQISRRDVSVKLADAMFHHVADHAGLDASDNNLPTFDEDAATRTRRIIRHTGDMTLNDATHQTNVRNNHSRTNNTSADTILRSATTASGGKTFMKSHRQRIDPTNHHVGIPRHRKVKDEGSTKTNTAKNKTEHEKKQMAKEPITAQCSQTQHGRCAKNPKRARPWKLPGTKTHKRSRRDGPRGSAPSDRKNTDHSEPTRSQHTKYF